MRFTEERTSDKKWGGGRGTANPYTWFGRVDDWQSQEINIKRGSGCQRKTVKGVKAFIVQPLKALATVWAGRGEEGRAESTLIFLLTLWVRAVPARPSTSCPQLTERSGWLWKRVPEWSHWEGTVSDPPACRVWASWREWNERRTLLATLIGFQPRDCGPLQLCRLGQPLASLRPQ